MSCPQIIHSGHFMVSEPHADPEPDPDPGPGEALNPAGQAATQRPRRETCVALQVKGTGPAQKADGDGARRGPGVAYDFDTVNEDTCLIYRYGPRSSGALNIDASLTRLFECMTLAYSGKIVSPKWKTFKGLKLLQRDKIRLNNAIWRAWYLQYVEKRQNPVCSFVTPLECYDIEEHRKPEAVIMEGKYWKRQIGVVIREYHKWRTFFHAQAQKKKDKPVCGPLQDVAATSPGEELNSGTAAASPMDLDPLHDLEDVLDTFFSSRNPYSVPNLRGLGHQGNADMIQPTLAQLHPIFGEEFMDTLDPIHEFISPCCSQPIVQAPALLADATGLGQCDPDAPPIAVQTKDPPKLEDDLTPTPISLHVEPPTPLNGHQTYLPFFPTSPSRTTPPSSTPILPMQPQTTLVFSVITHTGAEKISSLSTSRDTFVAPTSAPPAKSGRCRQLQPIAPAPPFSHHPGLSSSSLPHLLTAGPALLPLTPVTSSAKGCDTPRPIPLVILNSVSATQRSPLPLSAAATFDAGAKIKERGEEKPSCNSQEMYRTYTAKGNRRSTSTSADYARRMIISSGFNTLASLVLPGSDQISAKLSKAVLLQKSVAYVGRLQQERQQAQETVERLRHEVEELSTAIDNFQRQLPPSGAPVLPSPSDRVSRLYEEYVRQRTLQDWRFWLFSVLIKPLFESYIRTVNTGNIKEFCQSVLDWLDQHCTLPILRPAISGSLLQLSKITSILTQPTLLPAQAVQAVSCSPRCKDSS